MPDRNVVLNGSRGNLASPSLCSRRRWFDCLGVCALGCYAAHGAYHVSAGHPEHLLWACHVATLLAGIGLLGRRPSLCAAAALILVVGTPVWIVNGAAGGRLIPTSWLTHVGGLVISCYAVARLGPGRAAPLTAWALVGGLMLLAGIATPAEANVNLAFSAPWRSPATVADLALILAGWGLALHLVAWGLPRFFRADPVAPPRREAARGAAP